MGSCADLVLQNFYWRLESIAPTNPITGRGFVRYDPHLLDADVSSGLIRAFTVSWDSADSFQDVTDIEDRVAQHIYTVEVVYPIEKFKHAELQYILLQDRHDIIKVLRDSALFIGHDHLNSTTNIGLWSRFLITDELRRPVPTTWALTQRWRCDIKESE